MRVGKLVGAVAMTWLVALGGLAFAEDSPGQSELFERRILPLTRAKNASSCTECHLAGVELSQYVLDTEAATFAALRDGGLIDVENPARSKLLEFIARKPQREDPLLAKVRAEEYAAFSEWITAAAEDPQLLSLAPASVSVGAALPAEVVRHARRDRVLESFVENIWIEAERCVGCHSPLRNQRLIAKHGERISWISPDDPAGTLAKIIENDLVDVSNPDKSLILQKPLGEVEHGGHIKFQPGSSTDKQFRRFVNDYAAVVSGKYRTADDLPEPTEEVRIATGQHLRLTGLPLEFGRRLTRVDLHRWSDAGFSTRPVAMAESLVNPQNGQWQNMVFAIVPRSSAEAQHLNKRFQLPACRYLARVYVDRDDRLAHDRDADFTAADLYVEIEFGGAWPPGYSPPKIVVVPKGD